MSRDLAKAIQERREAIGLSQVRMAPWASVSHGTIRNAEAGKPLANETLGKLERALGWRAGTTEPLLSTDAMATLVQHYLLMSLKDKDMASRFRDAVHELVAALNSRTFPESAWKEAEDKIFLHLSPADLERVVSEVEAAAMERGLTESGRATESFQVDRKTATATPQAVKVAARVQGAMHASLPSLTSKATGKVATQQPPVVSITDEISLIVVPIPLSKEVADELSPEDATLLFDSLQAQGIEMAKVIVRAKRAERYRRGFELEDEFPPMNINTDKQGNEPEDDS